LKPEALTVKIHACNISQVSDFSIAKASDWFADLPKHLSNKHREIAGKVL
jgi:excinuclease ABC subunit A